MTLLSKAVEQDHIFIIRFLVEKALKQLESISDTQEHKKIMEKWVNQKEAKCGLSALHFAAYNGNLDICHMLMKHGADY